MVHADPPWPYDIQRNGAAAKHYDLLSVGGIAAHAAKSYAHATDAAYLLLWCTWPKLGEWMAQDVGRWRYVTGGSWHKTGRLGIGFHVRGDSEPWLLYVKGSPRPQRPLSNAVESPRQAHSVKPAAWLETAFRALSPPGGVVLDLYAGLGSAAVAARAAGLGYVGAEIDPQRHADAMAVLSQGRLWC